MKKEKPKVKATIKLITNIVESKKLMIVTADTNDGDYVDETNYVTEEIINSVKKVLAVIEKHDNHWSNGDMRDSGTMSKIEKKLSKKDHEAFLSVVPRGEHGIHTIVSVKIYTVIKEESL